MATQSALDSGQLFFINKSGSSAHLSNSLSQEKSAIQRHVQTGRKRSRKSKKANSMNDTLTTLKSLHPFPLPRSTHRDTTANDCIDNQADTSQDSFESVVALRSSNQHSESSIQKSQSTYDCTTSLDGQRLLRKRDPFDAASIRINTSVAGLLHYYMYYYHPSQWPNEMNLLKHGVYVFGDAVINNMRNATANKLSMYCLLTAAACRLQFVDRLPSPSIAGTENYYMHGALRLMTSHITDYGLEENGQLMQILTCMIFLNSAEAYRGDIGAAETHLKAAFQILRSRGGLAYVKDENMIGQLAMADLFLGCVNLRPCLFDCSYDPGSADSLNLQSLELSAQCTTSTATFLLDRADRILPSKLTTVINELVESHMIKGRISTASMSPARAMQVTHWITLRNMAIRHKLLALRTTDARTHALRVATIMWTLLAMNITGRAKTVKIMAPSLRSTLCETLTSDWIGSEDLKLWILLVGLHCASNGSDTSAWFMNEFCNLGDIMILLDSSIVEIPELTERLERFQLGFFFDIRVQRAQTSAFAKKLHDTHVYRCPMPSEHG